MRLADMALPQVLLGSESQLLAFAAGSDAIKDRLFFAPMPEMFASIASLRHAWQTLSPAGGERIGARAVHLRFGTIRSARVLKFVRNAAVVAEAARPPPLTASHHPFAGGSVLPAAMRRLFCYRPDAARPRPIGGGALQVTDLPPSLVTMDLVRYRTGAISDPPAENAALDLVAMPEFRSAAWAAGRVGVRQARLRGTGEQQPPTVLLPWNMDHPGSIVPELLERLLRLRLPEHPMPRLILLPFNYVGQTGIIRRLITRLRRAAGDPDAALSDFFIGRVTGLDGIAALRRLSETAWVDGNDPEHWWTLARLSACGIGSILIDPQTQAQAGDPQGVVRLAADETIWVEAETRCGLLTFSASLPSLRTLPRLLSLTGSRQVRAAPAAKRQRGRIALTS
jgi:hypothetical protein